MRTLPALLWRDLMVAKRRPINSVYKLVMPLLFLLLVFFLRNDLKPKLPKSIQLSLDNIKFPEEKFLDSRTTSPPGCLFYTPKSELAGTLIDEVGNQLGLTRLDDIPSTNICKGYTAFSNYSEIADLLNDTNVRVAVLEFKDMEGDSWSSRKQDRLDYTIRLNEKFHTQSYASNAEVPQSHKAFGDNYDDFMRIQWAIDSSYIKVRTGKTVPQTLSLQEFPYYQSTQASVATLVASLLLFSNLVGCMELFMQVMMRMMTERGTGIQELIKLNGVSSTTIGLEYFINSVPTAVMFAAGSTVLVKMGDNALIEYTSGVIIFIGLALYAVSIIACGMAFSYIAHTSEFATITSLFAYIATIVVAKVVDFYRPQSTGLVALTGLLPHIPMSWMWQEIAQFEQYHKPLTFTDIASSHTPETLSVLAVYLYCVVQSAFYFALTWYLSHVRQGNFGSSLPWNFLCLKGYWSKNEINPFKLKTSDEEAPIVREHKYFEEPPRNMEIGIKIENVSKCYPKNRALENVSLDVYKGEITVLLGHNGAGKTTLMSIITGMIPATQGKVYVDGVESASHGLLVRKKLGLCPQHNLFLDNINVIEHVMFFTMIKNGSTLAKARTTSQELLDRLGIGEKASSNPSELSGGMKRRLQLVCALAGGSEVLVLDEPTSGLDLETRRELWNLLLSLRGGHTVLLSTHFMEEADALGDRVAALHTGHLRCHATPMYLKKAMGSGYRLSFTTNGLPKESDITNVITHHVTGATVKEKTIASVSYNLPATGTPQFPALFAALEEWRSALAIETIGLGVSTLEEVFLKLCSDTGTHTEDGAHTEEETDADVIAPANGKHTGAMLRMRKRCDTAANSGEETDTNTEVTAAAYGKYTGARLYTRQAVALYIRHINYLRANFLMFFFVHILTPAFLMLMFTNATNNYHSYSELVEPDLLLDLNIYKPLPERRAFMNVNAKGASTEAMDAYRGVKFVKSSNITDDILTIGKKDILEYNKYLVGVELDDEHAKALYTTVYRHAAPVALNLLSNVIASQYLPAAGRAITAHNHPLDQHEGEMVHTPLVDAKTLAQCLSWALLAVALTLFTTANLHALPSRERASGARHLHVMAGCPAALHWLVTLTFHTALTLLTVVLIAIICAVIADKDRTLGQAGLLLTFALVLVLGSVAFFSLLYILSLCFEEKTTNILITFIIIIFGLLTPSIKTVVGLYETNVNVMVRFLLALASYVMPPHTVTIATCKVAYVGRLNALCLLNKNRCPDLIVYDNGFDSAKCCAGEAAKAYIAFDDYSPGWEMVIMLVQGVVGMTIVILIQKGFFNYLLDRIHNASFKNKVQTSSHKDDIVAAEALYVQKEVNLLQLGPGRPIVAKRSRIFAITEPELYGLTSKKHIEDDKQAMLVSDLHKNYTFLFKKNVHAVRGISLSVKKGECFGLLGTNGAGKSTTFKMLTAEVCPTKGQIYGNGHFMHQEKLTYLRTIGYCPQFLGIDEFQTANDNLKTLLTIRGLDDRDIEKELNAWIEVVGLKKYADTLACEYSGGYKRRLATAASLCSGAPLSLLDEPTAGVDVGARRRVHAALRRTLHQHRSIVITSHSMDEMEALCARIAIMVAGTVRALGSPAELRARHAQGHAVLFKVAHATDQVDSRGQSEVDTLKSTLLTKFDCTLKDEHKTMLHYHINDRMNYSDLFTQLEDLRKTFPNLIEDYSVTETTLEEVFLHFAREQQAVAEIAVDNPARNGLV